MPLLPLHWIYVPENYIANGYLSITLQFKGGANDTSFFCSYSFTLKVTLLILIPNSL